ncbi:MAG: HD domain-containing protein [Acidilobaceae archaeon]|nr:HD domain-containing protein [Acidilobaceae archaeon]MCX8166000.1 HD domain-containing protein [Acidilobaceae archaeon]MDW7974641.1 HD domain-containing protein [Sulfolobales archaeon]
MVLVSPALIESHVKSNALLMRAWNLLQGDAEVQELLRMSNVNATVRMLYNDHGPVHAAIVAGASLEIMELLLEGGMIPSSIAHGTTRDMDHARLIVMMGAYLHDIGNSVHRSSHEFTGVQLSYHILSRLLPELLAQEEMRLIYRIRSEIMNVIHSTAPEVQAITVEASIVKVADGTDMAEGRARIPYAKGKMDMHALSAMSIKRVELEPGASRPVRIKVFMNSYAGYFQLEHVLVPKIKSTLIRDHVEIAPILISKEEEQKPLPLIQP